MEFYGEFQRISKKYLIRDHFEVIASTPNMVFKESREYNSMIPVGFLHLFLV